MRSPSRGIRSSFRAGMSRRTVGPGSRKHPEGSVLHKRAPGGLLPVADNKTEYEGRVLSRKATRVTCLRNSRNFCPFEPYGIICAMPLLGGRSPQSQQAVLGPSRRWRHLVRYRPRRDPRLIGTEMAPENNDFSNDAGAGDAHVRLNCMFGLDFAVASGDDSSASQFLHHFFACPIPLTVEETAVLSAVCTVCPMSPGVSAI